MDVDFAFVTVFVSLPFVGRSTGFCMDPGRNFEGLDTSWMGISKTELRRVVTSLPGEQN